MMNAKQADNPLFQCSRRLAKTSLMALMVTTIAFGAQAANGQSYKEKTLHTFSGGADGATPGAGLIRDGAGNLYGVTFAGGANNLGTVFKVDAAGKERVLYSFKGQPDGEHPGSNLLRDKTGNLYGAAYEGGANGYGAIYKVDSSGNETVLYSFQSGTDGEYPGSGLIEDDRGYLYGTTGYGGKYGDGTMFVVSQAGQERVLYSFNGKDGQYPFCTLLHDSTGNFYGTTSMGGTYGDGTVFKLSDRGKETVLHNFANGKDGENPYDGLVQDKKGNLYGTTYGGGAGCYGFGCGTVFKITPKGKETILHAFGDTDGHYPDFGTLVLDSAGNLYGTTYAGGADDMGVVFEVSSSGSESILYSFTGGKDEGFPVAGLTKDKAGNFYGTTEGNGSSTWGTVFKLKP